jgi:hypothetical protein
MTFDELVDRVVARFDCTQAEAAAWLNERHRRMVGESLWRLAETDFGPTVVNQSDYALPDSVENVAFLMLGADTDPLARIRPEDMALLRSGGTLSGADQAFAMYADAVGVHKLRIWPTPTSVVEIIGLTAIDPATMVYGAGASPVIPVQFHSYLKDGAFADGFEEIEARWDLAGPFEQRYETGIQKLRRYRVARLASHDAQITLQP